ncbi:hypothetical protein [Streptomyces sp. NRRL F-2580]|uniref:hypothetical protein n=1 Tax=Streptomyces sp. NRRL F-2580 TaxID=1463841 RepID=UPI000A58F33A|nr:hypothetical protein [Streptomyces sp. NRRL F-2580]
MENGSGDDFSVLFTPDGVLIRGFDHESEMSPYGTDDEQIRPGVIDEVPAALRPLLDAPAFRDEGIDAPRVTACLWRKTHDTAWRTGSSIAFPAGSKDPDGSGFPFPLLIDRSPEAVQAHFEDCYERPVPLDAVRHILAGHPLTPAITAALNPAVLSDNALIRGIAALAPPGQRPGSPGPPTRHRRPHRPRRIPPARSRRGGPRLPADARTVR